MSKVDELKEKLQEVVETFKKKIPKLGKKKGDDDDEDEFDEDEFEEDTGQVEVDPSQMGADVDAEDATETGIGSPDEDDEDEEDEDDDEDDEDGDKKDIKKLLKKHGVKVILVVVLVAFGLDMVLNTEEELPQVAPVKKKAKRKPRKRRNRNKPAENKEATVTNNSDTPAVEAKKEPVVENTPEPTPEPTPVVENTQEPAVEPAPVVQNTPEPTPEPEPVVENLPEPVEQNVVSEEAQGIPPETPSEPLDTRVGEEVETKNLTMDDKVDEILEKSKENERKKLKKEDKVDTNDAPESYVEPPNYKRLGRGLVYNCVGKHWACVDKFSYFQCRENRKWSAANGKKPECVTRNVYASEKDCGVIQLHYINTQEPTGFCNDGSGEATNEDAKTKVMVK